MRHPRSTRAWVSARPRPREAPVTIPTGMPSRYDRIGLSCQRYLVLGPLIDEARANRKDRSLSAVVHAKLRKHVADVGLDRLLGELELLRDALVREATADQLQHLALPRRQLVERLLLSGERVDEPGRHVWIEQRLSGVGRAHGARELLRLGVLQQVPRGAGAERGEQLVVVREARQHDHTRAGDTLPERPHRRDRKSTRLNSSHGSISY